MDKKLSLYEISSELKPLEDALELSGGDTEELTPELVDRVTELLTASQAKVDAYGHYAKSIGATIEAIMAEIQRLQERKSIFMNKLKRLKDAADRAMVARGITKIEGELHTISRVKNGGRPSITLKVAPEHLPTKYQEVSLVANMEKIRENVNDPELLGLLEVQDTGYSVRIL
jgi:hypothetical protein